MLNNLNKILVLNFSKRKEDKRGQGDDQYEQFAGHPRNQGKASDPNNTIALCVFKTSCIVKRTVSIFVSLFLNRTSFQVVEIYF